VPAIRLEGFHRLTLAALACLPAPIIYFFEFGAIAKMNDASHQTRRVSQLGTGHIGAPCCSQYLKHQNVVDDVDELGDGNATSVLWCDHQMDDSPSDSGMIARWIIPPQHR
jgi:hypothetical protein